MTVYRSINVSENPEYKDAVRSGSVFMWRCPECGTPNLVCYEMLYHDPDRKMMLWLLPDETLEAKASEMAAIEKAVESMGDYTLRRCADVGSLMEKLLLAEAGLDDIVMELVKWVTRREMAEKDPSMAGVPMKFYKTGDDGSGRYIVLSFPKDGAMVGCTVGWNVYEDCLSIVSGSGGKLTPGKGFALVDSDWMDMRMG